LWKENIAKMILIVILSVFFVCLTVLVNQKYSYWRNLGIPYLKPTFPFGNVAKVYKLQRSFGTGMYDLYKQTTEPFIGFFMILRPAILIRDKDLVKNVLITDFEHFHDRGIHYNPKSDLLSVNLFSLPGDIWKPLRNKITPAFTSGKLKAMFTRLQNVGDNLVTCLTPLAKENSTIDMFDFSGPFVIDCLAIVAFGVDGVSTINEPNHEFKTKPEVFNNGTIISAIRNASLFAFPG
jgi:cytochrome P450 family 6